MISWLTFQAAYFFATGRNLKKLGSAHPLLVPYQAFSAKDRYFVLGVGNDSTWQRACKAMKLEDLAKDKRFDTGSHRVKHREELVELLASIFQKKKATYWLRVFDNSGVPSNSINTVKEALESRQTKERNLVLKIAGKSRQSIKTLASPVGFKAFGNLRNQNSFPPLLGEHSISVLKQFGFSDQEITKLLE